MTNSIAYLTNNSKKSLKTVDDGGVSLCLPGQLLVGGAAAASDRDQQPPLTQHDQPTPTHCIDALLLMFYV